MQNITIQLETIISDLNIPNHLYFELGKKYGAENGKDLDIPVAEIHAWLIEQGETSVTITDLYNIAGSEGKFENLISVDELSDNCSNMERFSAALSEMGLQLTHSYTCGGLNDARNKYESGIINATEYNTILTTALDCATTILNTEWDVCE